VRRAALVALLLATALAACTSGPLPDENDGGIPPGESATPDQAPVVLRVMEFNVEYGGTAVDFDGVPAAIEASGADVVAIEEGYASMPAIAASVGWEHYDPRSQVMSRFPLLTPAGDEPFVFVEVAPGRVVAVANVHLPSTSYGPFKVRDGASAEEVVAIEEHKRLAALEPALEAVRELAAQGVPVFLIGDFNAPSHLDWTEAAVGARDHVRFPVAWPVSLAVQEAGLVDSYREAHPDPVADPGLTWPANRPVENGYDPYANGAPADRIDFVYAGGPIRVTDSLLVGEEGGPGVDVPVTPWPADHRATVSTFEVEPAPEPVIVSVDRRLSTTGGDVSVRYNGPAGASLVFVRAGGLPSVGAIDEIPADGGGRASVSTVGWRPSSYEVVLVSGSGEELARTPFWLQRPGGRPVIGTDRRSYSPGEAIRVAWKYAPGNRWDWVGVYRRGADPTRASYLLWVYTGATVDGSATLDRDSAGAWPLRPGEYSVYLLQDDSYVKVAGADFTVC
jgi:hypothetical protein